MSAVQDICERCEMVYTPSPDGLRDHGCYTYGNALGSLVGETIQHVYISTDKTYLVFELTGGPGKLAFFTEGDCCSNSWIEHVENVGSLIGGKVRGVASIDLPSAPESTEDEDIKVYGVRVLLENRSPFLLEFRNASNGYYGGSIEPADLKDVPTNELRELTEDF